MWIYIPSKSAPASACSAKASVPHSAYSASSIEPFATWSGKPLQPRSLPALWKREPLIRLLSGLTCSPSTAQHGANAWISSLRASRARTSASPAGALDLMASARACSSTSSTSPTLARREALFWRASQPSLLPPPPLWTKPKALSKNAQPPASWENWPTAGGTRNGSLFQRQTWAPAMGVPGGSALPGGAWQTPRASMATCGSDSDQAGRPGLKDAVKHWPTPMAQDEEESGSANAGMLTLHRATAQWPTPASRDYRTPNSPNSQATRNHSGGEQLPNYIEHHFLRQALSIHDGRKLSPTARTLHRRLNPAFACWLMGWPIWWTNPALTSCVKSEMALYRCRLQQHLLNLCGAPKEGGNTA